MEAKDVQSLQEAYASMYATSEEATDLQESVETVEEGIVGALKNVAKKVLGPADQSPEAEAARTGKRKGPGTPKTDSMEKKKESPPPGDLRKTSASDSLPKRTPENAKNVEYYKDDVDIFDIVKGYLMTEHDATEEEALKVMLELTDDERQSILELKLPRSVTVIPPSGPKGDQRMYKAGGGDAAMNQKGQTRDQVIQQGRKNYVKQRGAAAREDIKRQDAGKVGRVNGQIPEFRVK